MQSNITIVLDLLGTFAFAISGIRLASGRQIDWFGAYIIGLVTAIGGGTTRDLLLDVSPFWMTHPRYFLTTAAALLAALFLRGKLLKLGSTLFMFDAIGLGLFTVTGISKSLEAGLPFWICIVMGTITGCLGGVARDVLLNEVPLLFRKDIYAMACVAGGGLYYICMAMGLSSGPTQILAVVGVIVIRLVAVRFHLHLPQLKPMDNNGQGK